MRKSKDEKFWTLLENSLRPWQEIKKMVGPGGLEPPTNGL